MTRDAVEEKVKEILVEVLGVDEEEVTPNARLFVDLDAESIDVLDIVFRLEKAFNIKVPKEELSFGDNIVNDPNLTEGGKLNAQGVAALKQAMPFANFEALEADPQVEHVRNLLTVNALTNYVMTKLA